MNPSQLFQAAATLVLGELPTPWDPLAETSVPLGLPVAGIGGVG